MDKGLVCSKENKRRGEVLCVRKNVTELSDFFYLIKPSQMHQKKLWKVPWMRKDDKETKIYLKCMYVMYLFIFIFLLVIVTISRFIASLPLIEVFLKRNTCTHVL